MSFLHPVISSLTLALPPARKVPGKQTSCLQKSRENAVQTDASHTDDLSETPQERFVLPVHGVADFLSMRGAKSTVLVLSPTGDDGSTASVMLARSMAELGRSVVLVDMTVSGCPTRLMAAEPDLPGMADLLFGETAFGETIHHDRLSNAHIVPQGLSPVLPSGKITERLMMIVGGVLAGLAALGGLIYFLRRRQAKGPLKIWQSFRKKGNAEDDVPTLEDAVEVAAQ